MGVLRKTGSTMIELLIAVVILGIASTVLLNSVNSAILKQSYAQRRASILASLQNSVDTARSTATGGTIPTGTTTSTLTLEGISGNVTVSRTTTLVAGYSDLYTVDAVATWTEVPATGLTRADQMELTTLIRSNDT